MEEEIQEERSSDEAGQHGNAVVIDVDDPPWVKYMVAKLAFKSKHCNPSHPFTISRVPRHIRSVDNVAHDPLIVSIGPYHRGNPSLHQMEEIKWRNLDEIRRRYGNKFKDYLKVMKEIEPEARACYSGNINMDADEFIEMMLLDGLFIIELLSKWAFHFFLLEDPNFDEEEPICAPRGTLDRVGHDMLLLENQLPFFVLERLWNLTPSDECSWFDLWRSACAFFYVYYLQFEQEYGLELLQEIFDEKEKKNPEIISAVDVHHLLHLGHLFLTYTQKSKPTGSSDQSEDSTAKLPAPRCHPFPSRLACQSLNLWNVLKNSFHSYRKSSPGFPSNSKEEQPPSLTVIPCAEELDEAGVKFECVKAKSFLDVKFEQGKMKMPRLVVEDFTKSLLRNFIAYEQCFPKQGSYFTSYCSFMDNLVNTPRDVEILKRFEIVENFLGCDKEVADLFNDLCKGIIVPVDRRNYLAKPSKDVRNYAKKLCPKWRAKLLHDYFGSPWSIISFLAATIVVVCTIVQTCYAVFT